MRRPALMTLLWLTLVGCSSAASPSPAAVPPGWRYIGWSDPAIEVALPADWEAFDLATVRAGLAEPVDDAATQRANTEVLRELDAGEARLNAGGSLAPSGYGVLSVLVQSGDTSLVAAVDRHIQEDREIFGAAGEISRSDLVLAVGPAVRLSYNAVLGASGTNHSTGFVIRLTDGRTLTLYFGTGPDDNASLDLLADQSIRTLRPAP